MSGPTTGYQNLDAIQADYDGGVIAEFDVIYVLDLEAFVYVAPEGDLVQTSYSDEAEFDTWVTDRESAGSPLPAYTPGYVVTTGSPKVVSPCDGTILLEQSLIPSVGSLASGDNVNKITRSTQAVEPGLGGTLSDSGDIR